MPSDYNREIFNDSINKRIRRLFDAAKSQSKKDLLINLIEVEEKFHAFYTRNPRKAKEMFRGLLQSLIHYICLHIKDGHPEYLCRIIMTQCRNIFHIPASGEEPCSTMIWTHPHDQNTLFHAAETRGFNTLLEELITQGSFALNQEAHHPHPLLKKSIHLITLKQSLLQQFQRELSMLWRPNENRLISDWETLFRPYFENHVLIQVAFSEEEVVPLEEKDVVMLTRWLDQFRQALTELMRKFRDPITNHSILDAMPEYQQNDHPSSLPEDPMCFLGDGNVYLLSTFKQLIQSNTHGSAFTSPVTHEEMEPITQASNSLIGFFRFSRTLKQLKDSIQRHSEISIKKACKIVSIGKPSLQRRLATTDISHPEVRALSHGSPEVFQSPPPPAAMLAPPPYPGHEPSAPYIPQELHAPSAPSYQDVTPTMTGHNPHGTYFTHHQGGYPPAESGSNSVSLLFWNRPSSAGNITNHPTENHIQP